MHNVTFRPTYTHACVPTNMCTHAHENTQEHSAHTQHIHIEEGGANVTEASKMFDFEDQCQPLGRPGKEPPTSENWE